MAGYNSSNNSGQPPGTTWDSRTGTWMTQAQLNARAEAEARRSQSEGYAREEVIYGRNQDTLNRQMTQQQAAQARMDAVARAAAAQQRFNLMREDLRHQSADLDSGGYGGGDGGGSGGGGGGGTGGGYDAADTATYGRAKDRTAKAMTASLRGLDEEMNQRGITGSGIQARGLSQLFAEGQGQLSETDRQMAEGTAGRNYQSTEAARQRSWQSGENAANRRAQLASSRLSSLMQLYGMAY